MSELEDAFDELARELRAARREQLRRGEVKLHWSDFVPDRVLRYMTNAYVWVLLRGDVIRPCACGRADCKEIYNRFRRRVVAGYGPAGCPL